MLVSVVGPASPSSSCDIYICATTLSATQVTARGSDRVTDDDFTVAVANLKNPVIMDEVGVIGAVPCTRLDVSAAAAVTATVCSDSINANSANLSPCQFIARPGASMQRSQPYIQYYAMCLLVSSVIVRAMCVGTF